VADQVREGGVAGPSGPPRAPLRRETGPDLFCIVEQLVGEPRARQRCSAVGGTVGNSAVLLTGALRCAGVSGNTVLVTLARKTESPWTGRLSAESRVDG